MVNTELDEVKIFVDAIDATTTVNHNGNVGNIKGAGPPPVIFINNPEIPLIDTYNKEYVHRYKLELQFLTEATLTTAFKALISNIDKLSRRAAIAGYTKPSTIAKIDLVNLGKIAKKIKNLWKAELYLEVTWCES